MATHLEAYLRVAYSEHYPPGTLLGPFINRARQLADNGCSILPEEDLDELDTIKEYANRFHHDSNAAWGVAVSNINENELVGFVRRVIAFTTRGKHTAASRKESIRAEAERRPSPLPRFHQLEWAESQS